MLKEPTTQAEFTELRQGGPADISVWTDGMIGFHNMPCPVHGDTEKAVLSLSSRRAMIFAPSWRAQEEGWRLVKLEPGEELRACKGWFSKLFGCFLRKL